MIGTYIYLPPVDRYKGRAHAVGIYTRFRLSGVYAHYTNGEAERELTGTPSGSEKITTLIMVKKYKL